MRGTVFSTSLLMTGCPIFPNGGADCDDDSGCARGFVCDVEEGECIGSPQPFRCNVPVDCEFGLTCGADLRCHTAACDVVGCPDGWQCVAEDGAFFCLE